MSDASEVPHREPVASYYQNVRREIEPLLPKALDAVLEIGCGSGSTMEWIRSVRPTRYAAGVELFPAAAEIAKSVFDAVETADVNSARYNFEVGQFDAILALDVLEHLADPAPVVRRLCEKLKPGGVFIASIPNIAHYSASLPLLFRGTWEYEDEGLLDGTHLRFFTRRSALALFTDVGLRIVGLKIVRKGPNILGLLTHPNRTVRWYARRLCDAVFRWPRHLFAFQFLIAAQRQ